jgi:uroporphyrinogen decarboxylase
MAYAGVLNDFQLAIGGARPKRMPALVCSEEADVRIAGSRYDRYNSDVAEMVRVQKEVVDRFDYDWVWLQVDDCMEFEPLGVKVEGGGDILPATCGYLPWEPAAVEHLREKGYQVVGRMRVLLDAISELKNTFGDTVCVCGRTAAPFSSVTLAFGIQETLLALFDCPDLVREALKVFVDYQTAFGLDQIKAGADAIWLGDCNASGHLISPEIYREYALGPAREVAAAYREAGGIVHSHNSEENPALLAAQVDADFSIINCGPGIDMTEARRAVGPEQCLSGNVDPIETLMRGTPEQVRESVLKIIETVSADGAHIMCSGEMVPRDTPEENLAAFVQATRDGWAAQ